MLVYRETEDVWVTGAVELITPATKDHAAARDKFVARCITYIDHSVGLILVDVVTDRPANLHAELMARVGQSGNTPEPKLYAAAYRQIKPDGIPGIDVWVNWLALDHNLPTLPLWLPGGVCLPVDLEETYTRTCQEQRVISNGA